MPRKPVKLKQLACIARDNRSYLRNHCTYRRETRAADAYSLHTTTVPAKSPAAVGLSRMLSFFFDTSFCHCTTATSDACSILRAVDLNTLRSLAVSAACAYLEAQHKTVPLCLYYTFCCFFPVENACTCCFMCVKLRAFAALHSMRLKLLNNKQYTCIDCII